MKKIVLLILGIFTGYAMIHAQAPGFLNYQGVARNAVGNIISNKTISLRLTIHDGTATGPAVYSETRTITTNAFGLFNVQIGSPGASAQTGSITSLPWLTGNKFIQVEIDPNGGSSSFMNVGTTQLASVPFSLYTNQSGDIVLPFTKSQGENGSLFRLTNTGNNAGSSAFEGVSQSSSTNAFAIKGTAPIGIGVYGASTTGVGLYGQSVSGKALRTQGALQFSGIGEALNKVLATDINGNATWQNAASVGIVSGSGTLNYVPRWTPDGTAISNSQIFDNGTNMSIAGPINPVYKLNMSGRLRVAASADDSAIAVFENTSGGVNSDGIVIKLGRTHGAWNGSSYANVTNPITQGAETQVNQIRNWIYGVEDFEWSQLINLMPSQYLTGTVCNLTNLITTKLNDALNLPLRIGPYSTPSVHIWDQTTIFGGIDLGAFGSIPALRIPALTIPSVAVIPNQITVMPRLPELSCAGLPTLALPTFVFTDVNNSLSNKNEFISFVDKDNRQLGAIKATSIQDFSYNYFDGQKLLDLAAEFIGIDIVDDFMSIISGVSEMVGAYNSIGVEYTSGHGDYAEWLERADPKEEISYGDIVAVKAGRITKNLAGAEQIMAVSKNPIVLGNMPDKSRIASGNNIAFMGQIPVKVMGPVRAGDYIVAKSEVSGYGIAVHPKDMTIEDFKLSVGRSWDTNEKTGPKMVNTVVGVHNNDFLNIVGSLQQRADNLQHRADNSEQRLKTIETMLNINSAASGTTPVPAAKKAFK
jgi:hypothetical protein